MASPLLTVGQSVNSNRPEIADPWPEVVCRPRPGAGELTLPCLLLLILLEAAEFEGGFHELPLPMSEPVGAAVLPS